ncbi:hypothetical protein [Clostridium sp. DMHC 10]|nr:hypothetical protein [Clostridium sp. DMHC 10]
MLFKLSFMGGLPGRAMSIVSSIGRSIIGGFNSAISFITFA